MAELSLLNKLKIITNALISSSFGIILLIFIAISLTVLLLNIKYKSKAIYIFYSIFLISYIGYLIYMNIDSIITGSDYIITLIMANYFFPSMYLFVAESLISIIILIGTFISKKLNIVIRIINYLFFSLLTLLFVLFFYTANKNGIILTKSTDFYTNNELLSTLELASLIFIIWVVILISKRYITIIINIFKPNKIEEKEAIINTFETIKEHAGTITNNLILAEEELELISYDSATKKEELELISWSK